MKNADMIRKKGITTMIKYTFSRIISPVVRICVAVSILVGHLFAGIVLFSLQDSVTCRNVEKVLLAEISSVQKSLSLASSVTEPEYMYLFTEYDVVGENGGVIIADSLHDIHCGKRIESCRTLEDAGIDINKYKPLRRNVTQVFGVPCHFAYFKNNDAVIVAYLPVVEQTQQRNVNVFSALGTTFIFSVLLFFLVPLAIQLITKNKSLLKNNASGAASDSRFADDVFDDGGLDETPDADETELGEASSESDEFVQDIELPEEEEISSQILAGNAQNEVDDVADEPEPAQADGEPCGQVEQDEPEADEAGTERDSGEHLAEPEDVEPGAELNADEASAEPEDNSYDQNEIADYVSRMQDLKRTAHQLGDEKLFKMADYLEKCGKAILAGSKDADKFMAEIESKTPIAAKYYENCIQQHDARAFQQTQNAEQIAQSAADEAVPQNAEQPAQSPADEAVPQSAPSEQSEQSVSEDVAQSAEKPAPKTDLPKIGTPKVDLPEEADLPKTDMSPAEIFATLEALYDGAASADDTAVNTQISTLRRINLPRKLKAVFPELELAAAQSDFTRIKAVIDSLRTGNHA